MLARCETAAGRQSGDGVKTCRRVLSTSNGWVTNADTVPDKAPEMKEVVMGESGGNGEVSDASLDLIISNPAQYMPISEYD